MSKLSWGIFGVFAAAFLLLLGGTHLWRQHRRLQASEAAVAELRTDVGAREAQIGEVEEQFLAAQARVRELEEQLAQNQERVAELEAEKSAVLRARETLEEEMRTALSSKDVTISQLQGRLSIDILDRVLFDLGKAELKAEGQQVLGRIGAVLQRFPNRQVLVVGHTDNIPIRPGSKSGFASNWELSTGRATAAVRYLCEKAGVDPRRIGAVGFGEHRPIADNGTPAGRAENRRITLLVLSDELAAGFVAAPRPAAVSAPAEEAGPAAAPEAVPEPPAEDTPTPEETPAPDPADDEAVG